LGVQGPGSACVGLDGARWRGRHPIHGDTAERGDSPGPASGAGCGGGGCRVVSCGYDDPDKPRIAWDGTDARPRLVDRHTVREPARRHPRAVRLMP
jgi:hypothetical protein